MIATHALDLLAFPRWYATRTNDYSYVRYLKRKEYRRHCNLIVLKKLFYIFSLSIFCVRFVRDIPTWGCQESCLLIAIMVGQMRLRFEIDMTLENKKLKKVKKTRKNTKNAEKCDFLMGTATFRCLLKFLVDWGTPQNPIFPFVLCNFPPKNGQKPPQKPEIGCPYLFGTTFWGFRLNR